ncbi:lanthionine synthetase LanC family protein [Pedobacter jeongneungensis]|uniref:lanthionine synthetase LanC family protein n=1 Tax=Pedobacter jeongneungensis TaxID=947309 RepID=UPI00046965E2|nr:lanthionine synthetase LanC family protein [Pedobacter jeongneungensis]
MTTPEKSFDYINPSSYEIVERLIFNGVKTLNNSLFSGQLGYILYLFESSRLTGEDAREEAEGLLYELFEKINATTPAFGDYSLANGYTGFCLLVNYLEKQGFIEIDVEDELYQLDLAIANKSIADIKLNNTDFLYGATGYLHYFAERNLSPFIKQNIESLLKRIFENEIIDEEGLRFRNAFYHKEPDENNHINFGLAHGNLALGMVFLNLADKDPTLHWLRKKAELLAHYMIKHLELRAGDDAVIRSLFPSIIRTDGIKCFNKIPVAWCYGDLAICIFLYRVGQFSENDQYRKVADQIGHLSMKETFKQLDFVNDPFFCHGSAGIAQLYKSLYQLSNDENYLNHYEFWIDRTNKIIATKYRSKDINDAIEKPEHASLLEGLIGTALVLNSYKNNIDPWKSIFLL